MGFGAELLNLEPSRTLPPDFIGGGYRRCQKDKGSKKEPLR